jgi:hypothetical protein
MPLGSEVRAMSELLSYAVIAVACVVCAMVVASAFSE